ncbi:hypothetical protein DFH05DRAFT_1463488 [Lentinula detonsa]|uniref:Uncharacterized protein n=1 Tax=Lentinula detonsa TaxID=2804962 RepID=A0A9W8TTS3_9AGAR|nr:hypothetical protein DFH05DRAFT_1463488 [Lentinula detonsa]
MGSKKNAVARRRGRPPARHSKAKEIEEQEPDSPAEIVQVTPRPKPRLIFKPRASPKDMTAIPDDSEAAKLLMELGRPSGDKSVPTQEEEKILSQGALAGSKSPTPSLQDHQKEFSFDGEDSTHSGSDSDEPEALEITYEAEKDGLVHDFSVMNTASFSNFLRTAARMLGVSITHLGSLGYIPSFLPKNPKPLPRALNSNDAYEKMLEKIEEYVLTAKSRNKGKGVVKAFSIRLVDSSGSGDMKKDKNEKKNGKSKDGTPALDIDPNDKEHAIHKELENHYVCDSHPKKACWVLSNGTHYQLTTQDLSTWAMLLKKHRAVITEPPPPVMENIEKNSGPQAAIKARARGLAAGDPWSSIMPPSLYGWYGAPPPPPYGGYSQYPPPPLGPASPTRAAPASSPPSTPSKHAVTPLISEWLVSLDEDAERGQDKLNFSQFAFAFLEEGIIRVDDLVDLETPERLQKLIMSNWGTANRLLKYARQEVASCTKRNSKKA